MNIKNISKIISERPEEIKKVIFSSSTFNLIENIAIEEGLTEEQFLLINDDIISVLVGIKNTKDFEKTLSGLEIKDGSKIKIISKIKKDIFEKVSGYLEKTTEINSKYEKMDFDQNALIKIKEIASKYSLNERQAEILTDCIKANSLDRGKIKNFIKKDLNISDLTTEQIMGDLEKRVFEPALKMPNTDTKKTGDEQQLVSIEKVVPVTPNAPRVPEVKPNNLPMVEEGEVAHSNPVPNTTKTEQKIEMPKMAEVPRYTPPEPIQIDIDNIEKGDTEKIEMVREPVQEPVPVPRITAVPLTEDKPEVETKPQEAPVINRMPIQENPTSSKINPIKTEADQKPAESSVKKYTADPYREPLG